ncbi:MAG: pilus assembly protein PilP [Ghiorsea sp.]
MRIIHLLIPLLSLLFLAQPVLSNTAVNPVPEQEDEAIPDAMARLMTAPKIDLENIRDPFLSSFEKARIEEAKRFNNRKTLPAYKRKREVLEYFDLTTLTLVGTFQKRGHDWVASVEDSTGKAYTVHRGNYMGKRGGQIEKIDGKTIYLVEQRMNPAGEIVDRQVTLTLAEVNDQF